MSEKPQKSGNKKAWLAAGAVAAAAVCMGGLYAFSRQTPVQGIKHITVEVIHSDGTKKEFTYETEAEYLGDFLEQEGLIAGEDSQYGLFVQKVDGEEAAAADGSWWQLLENGTPASVGADQVVIDDQDVFVWQYSDASDLGDLDQADS